MFSLNSLRHALAALVPLALIASGWTVRGWYEAKQIAEAHQAVERHDSKVAAALESRLSELKANERIIEREKLKIVDRPVYRNVCLDADGVRIANQAKNGTAKSASEVQ